MFGLKISNYTVTTRTYNCLDNCQLQPGNTYPYGTESMVHKRYTNNADDAHGVWRQNVVYACKLYIHGTELTHLVHKVGKKSMVHYKKCMDIHMVKKVVYTKCVQMIHMTHIQA